MKKKLKLKRWVRFLITALVIGAGIVIYSGLKTLGSEATTTNFAGTLCIVGWFYLVFGQIGILICLWEV